MKHRRAVLRTRDGNPQRAAHMEHRINDTSTIENTYRQRTNRRQTGTGADVNAAGTGTSADAGTG